MTSSNTPFLDVRDLNVRFPTDDGVVRAVDGLSFTVQRGKTLGIVGESGSGKTVTGLSLLGLHDRQRTQISGQIWLEGTDLLTLDEGELNELRGEKIAMIFQDPLTALSPFYTIGNQIAEGYRRHAGGTKQAARKRAIDLLGRVGIPQPERRVDNYPHEFSGGMRQRAMIAMSLANNPALLIADEPTTALDVTVQAQILDLLEDLQREFNSAIILVTHDLGVISQVADDVLVMYAGRCVEKGDVRALLSRPQMPYTWGLLSSIPRLNSDVDVPLVPVRGAPPSLIDLPAGCPFQPRCDHAWRVVGDRCRTERPLLRPSGVPHGELACHLDEETRNRIVDEDLLPLWEGSHT
ncbi:MAG: peptide/nickel transport system ATP-binding protein [Actinomycetota bacterium]|nr:peptide/nickel transport system ATP-binding protein [Actinomycetota bacterium]